MVIITDSTNRIDKERFSYALGIVQSLRESKKSHSIGTLGEKSLHAVLKWYYEPDGSRHEVPVGEHIADIVGEDGITEIQTRSLSHLRPKLTSFPELCRVTVVHPIICSKRVISVNGETGEVISVRKSPRHGTVYTEMRELYSLREWLPDERLTLRLPLLTADEYRTFGVSTRRRKKQRTRRGEYVSDIIPTDIIDEIILRESSDYAVLIPKGLPEEFTASDFAAAAATDEASARMAINLLLRVHLVEQTGREGRKNRWRLARDCNFVPNYS